MNNSFIVHSCGAENLENSHECSQVDKTTFGKKCREVDVVHKTWLQAVDFCIHERKVKNHLSNLEKLKLSKKLFNSTQKK